jgi:hypothetical protein
MPMCMRALSRMAPSLYREAISAMPLRVRITIGPAIDRPWRRPCRPSPPSRQPVDQCAKRMRRICDTHFDAVFDTGRVCQGVGTRRIWLAGVFAGNTVDDAPGGVAIEHLGDPATHQRHRVRFSNSFHNAASAASPLIFDSASAARWRIQSAESRSSGARAATTYSSPSSPSPTTACSRAIHCG